MASSGHRACPSIVIGSGGSVLVSAGGSFVESAEVEDLPKALIRARIAAGMTQEGLARRLGVKTQQIQRYEATEYESASFARIRTVVQALGLRMPKPTRLVRG